MEEVSNEFVNSELNRENYGNEVDETMNVEDELEVPTVGMLFNSVDELYNFYKSYGKEIDFAVCIRSSTKHDDGGLKYLTVVCTREGKPRCKSNNLIKRHPVTKMDCKARITGAICSNGKWIITSVNLDHNHVVSPDKSRFYRCNREIAPYVKRRLEMNDRAGIRMNKSINSFVVEAGGHEKLPFLEKDCRNYIEKVRRLRLGEGDATAIHNYFLKMQADNSDFFYMMDLDDSGRLRNVFWADARSRAALKEFGDVITFDMTYLTNKYDMPFIPFCRG